MKNWLIRTKSNYLLGPISREKLLELIDSGSVQPDDEVCSGNGYWIYVKEKNLIEKYVRLQETQSFNQVSEAIQEKAHRGDSPDEEPKDITLIMKSNS
jgi:hypothetical protein